MRYTTYNNMSKPIILTGLRANNDLHLGNYLGALMPLIDVTEQKAGKHRVQLFVPDLHSFTTPIDHSKLQEAILENIKTYVALGLPIDHSDVFVYRQSYIPPHSELTWILSCFTSFGEMARMTQFKEKRTGAAVAEGTDDNPWKAEPVGYEIGEVRQETPAQSVSLGLFSYPVLMAADILLYGASYVPVGDDQTQHLEFTRDIAQRINNRFNAQLFEVPHEVKKQHAFFGKDQGLRIRDLSDPSKKMSKSDESGKGVIFLNDSPEVARKKVLSATTDSHEEIQYDYETRPGISNLLDIYELMGGDKRSFIGKTQYGPLKTAVADSITTFLTQHQDKLQQIDQKEIMTHLEQSERTMRLEAGKRLLEVQKAVGLRS